MKKSTILSIALILIFTQSISTKTNYNSDYAESMPKNEKASILPRAYGFYLIDKGELIELAPKPVTTIVGLPLRVGNIGYALDGMAGEPYITINSNTPIIIVFQQNVDVNSLLLYEMVYVKTMEAQQFNIQNTEKRFFSNIYKKNYYDIVDINLWRPKNEISLKIEPVEGKFGMYKFIPKSSLIPGNYVLYFKGELHKDKTIFSSDFNRKASAFYFKIKSYEEKTAKAELNEATLNKLLMETKVAVTSAKNHDIRYSAAPNSTSASKEKATIIISLDKAIDSLNQALDIAGEILNPKAVNLIKNSQLGIEEARKSYMGGGGGATYSKLKKIEKELRNYLEESSKTIPPKDEGPDSSKNSNIEAMNSNLKNLLEETLATLAKARKYTVIKYIIQDLDEAIKKLDLALGIASSINDSDAMSVIQKARDYLNESRAKYFISNSYEGIGEHKDAISVLKKFLKSKIT